MKKTVVIDVVGLTPALVKKMPFLSEWSSLGQMAPVTPPLPAVTTSSQYTYLTGKWPNEHGIVGNGWYFRTECEIKFWRQSNKLVQAPKIWEVAKEKDSSFTCSNMFWWYNMYSSVDYSATPRPNYLADGRKLPDSYTQPADLRDMLQEKLGIFPLFDFWGPKTSIKSSRWIADASMIVEKLHTPTLTLIYLPHLDYNLQRYGNNFDGIDKDLTEIDEVCKDLITFYESRDTQVVVLSEYGITNVNRSISLNRVLREHGYLAIREERGLELLDAGASKAFAVADHQIAHIYVRNKEETPKVRELLEKVEGVELLLGEEGKYEYHLDHPRAGELVAVADKDSWFNYYYWMDDKKAPDFARCVDIHRKPGYDPVETFIDPNISFPLLKVGRKLVRKKLGFRVLMDVIPLRPELVRGSHGRPPDLAEDGPLIISKDTSLIPEETVKGTDVFNILLSHLQYKSS